MLKTPSKNISRAHTTTKFVHVQKGESVCHEEIACHDPKGKSPKSTTNGKVIGGTQPYVCRQIRQKNSKHIVKKYKLHRLTASHKKIGRPSQESFTTVTWLEKSLNFQSHLMRPCSSFRIAKKPGGFSTRRAETKWNII